MILSFRHRGLRELYNGRVHRRVDPQHVKKLMRILGVTRKALSDPVNLKSGVSVDMAHRLSQAFGSSPETWLRMQMAYDLWQGRDRAKDLKVEDFSTVSVA